MGFLSGSVTFERFRVTEDPTGAFGDEHLDLLKKHRIDSSKTNLFETAAIGFTGGAHLLDTKFDHEKNILGEALYFGIRCDTCQIPGPIKQAWMKIELSGMMKDNPGGRPTKSQREEAKQAVEALCEQEADKGNYRRMSVTPVLWDAETETIYLGGTSEKSNDLCLGLLNNAFGLEFSRVTSGKLALELAESEEQKSGIYGATPAAFLPDRGNSVVWWNGMNDNYDFLGNEFLLWLWWQMETNSDVFELSDETEVGGMFARSLSLDCPQGENGKESISSESPVALPESRLAIRMGKLPRKAGLTLVREGEQYELTLKAETLSISSARITQIGEDVQRRDVLDRIESIRQMSETIDMLFGVFCDSRLSKSWKSSLNSMTEWLHTEARTGQASKKKAA